MNFREYKEFIKDTPYPDTLEYAPIAGWPHPQTMPLKLISIGNTALPIIKIPRKAVNQYGNIVIVEAIDENAFAGKGNITDILLSKWIHKIPQGAFRGCSGLKRITLPKAITRISAGTFDGCKQLEDVYYEGTPEEWKGLRIEHQKHEIEFGDLIPGTPVNEVTAERLIHIPGNDALFSANIHFRCEVESFQSNVKNIRMPGLGSVMRFKLYVKPFILEYAMEYFGGNIKISKAKNVMEWVRGFENSVAVEGEASFYAVRKFVLENICEVQVIKPIELEAAIRKAVIEANMRYGEAPRSVCTEFRNTRKGDIENEYI